MQKNGPQWLIVLMLGVIIVLLTVLLTQRTAPSQAHADAEANAGDRFAMVTGGIGSDQSCLWLLDSANNTISVYTCMGGAALAYVGTRPIKYEVQLTAPLNDRSRNAGSYQSLKEAFKKQNPEDR